VNVFLRSVSIDGRVGRAGCAGRAGSRSGGRNPMGNSAGSAPRRTAGQPAFCEAVDVRSSGFRPTGECCARACTAAGPRQGPPPRFRALRDPRRDRALEAAVRGLRRAGGFAMRPHGRRLLASLVHGTRPGERFSTSAVRGWHRSGTPRSGPRCRAAAQHRAGGAVPNLAASPRERGRRGAKLSSCTSAASSGSRATSDASKATARRCCAGARYCKACGLPHERSRRGGASCAASPTPYFATAPRWLALLSCSQLAAAAAAQLAVAAVATTAQ